jgi:hypothetical protein
MRPGTGRKEWASDLLHRFEVAVLVQAPYLDHHGRAGLSDPLRLAQCSHHVVREEERVEAGDEVEGVVRPRQVLHFADAQVGVREAVAGERDERIGGVEPVGNGAALGDKPEESADPAADIENVRAGVEADSLECSLVRWQLPVLAFRPVSRSGSPKRTPARRAALLGGRGGRDGRSSR